jgi:uncharacterized membrane protein
MDDDAEDIGFLRMTLITVAGSCLVTAIAFGVSWWLARQLPDSIPVKFDGSGHPTRYGGKFATFYLMPCLMAVITAASVLPLFLPGGLKVTLTSLTLRFWAALVGTIWLIVHLWIVLGFYHKVQGVTT